MRIAAKVNPDNDTECWFTWDGREPHEDDNDFGADFSFNAQDEAKTVEAIRHIVSYINSCMEQE